MRRARQATDVAALQPILAGTSNIYGYLSRSSCQVTVWLEADTLCASINSCKPSSEASEARFILNWKKVDFLFLMLSFFTHQHIERSTNASSWILAHLRVE